MVIHRLLSEQYRTLPVLVNESTSLGKTYIITGGNSGLGFETARHLVKASAATVILAVRNLTAGQKAKDEIEKSTGRTGVVQVRHLDMSSYASVQSFAQNISAEVDRIDGFVCNVGVMLDAWSTTEGFETSIFVNVISTVFLGVLIMPKLSACARKFGSRPTVVFIVSILGYIAKGEMDKSRGGPVFELLNDEKLANIDQRYAMSKLIEEAAVRQLAALCPVERTGVVVAMVAPGLCATGLGHQGRTFTKIVHGTLKALMARTAEEGSRTYLHGLVVGPEGHGKLLSGCKIKENWVPDWLLNEEGLKLQKDIWKDLATELERVQPGCISQLASLSILSSPARVI